MTGRTGKWSVCLWLALFAVWLIVWEAACPKTVSAEGVAASASEAEQELTAALHAGAAVLLDMDNGRILYEKNGSQILPMASTTKIMTCILALEDGNLEDTVTASAYAAGQPKVHLGMQKGSSYRMEDLLCSLMLESHNDSAVAIAEHIGSKGQGLLPEKERTKEQSREAVQIFCIKMTEKAKEIGCENTCFLTPNGLDAETVCEDGRKLIHSTTAGDLAKIMRYCVMQSPKREKFLEITRLPSVTFTDAKGVRSHFCSNHNAFLNMMDGALSGKTGFTNQAGYCYVGALEQGEKKFALALLACGWPGHKTWKWEDAGKLFRYGQEQYAYREFSPEVTVSSVRVENGAAKDGNPYHTVSLMPIREGGKLPVRILTRADETVTARVQMVARLKAPVAQAAQIGTVSYYLTDGNGCSSLLAKEKIFAGMDVEKKDFSYFWQYLFQRFCCI